VDLKTEIRLLKTEEVKGNITQQLQLFFQFFKTVVVSLYGSKVCIKKAGNVRRVWAGKMFIIRILTNFRQN